MTYFSGPHMELLIYMIEKLCALEFLLLPLKPSDTITVLVTPLDVNSNDIAWNANYWFACMHIIF